MEVRKLAPGAENLGVCYILLLYLPVKEWGVFTLLLVCFLTVLCIVLLLCSNWFDCIFWRVRYWCDLIVPKLRQDIYFICDKKLKKWAPKLVYFFHWFNLLLFPYCEVPFIYGCFILSTYTMSHGDHNIVDLLLYTLPTEITKSMFLYTWHCFKLKLVGPCAKVKVQRNETYLLRNATSRELSFSCLVRAVELNSGSPNTSQASGLKRNIFRGFFTVPRHVTTARGLLYIAALKDLNSQPFTDEITCTQYFLLSLLLRRVLSCSWFDPSCVDTVVLCVSKCANQRTVFAVNVN